MASEVRNMVATNPDSVDGIQAILDRASPEQNQSIGAGLGQAAGLCARRQPDSARRIQEAVLRMNKDVVLSYELVTGDRQTASTGGGVAGGGGGGGGGTGVSSSTTANGSNFYSAPSTSSYANQSGSFSSGSGSSLGLTTARTSSSTITIVQPLSAASPDTTVSPNR